MHVNQKEGLELGLQIWVIEQKGHGNKRDRQIMLDGSASPNYPSERISASVAVEGIQRIRDPVIRTPALVQH